jgi:hypothetical protein
MPTSMTSGNWAHGSPQLAMHKTLGRLHTMFGGAHVPYRIPYPNASRKETPRSAARNAIARRYFTRGDSFDPALALLIPLGGRRPIRATPPTV